MLFSTVFFLLGFHISSALPDINLRSIIAEGNKEKLLEALNDVKLKKGLNKPGMGGQTPLMSAVLSGETYAIEPLLAAGADYTIPEKDGYTPMHGAGFQGRAEIVPILAAHGVPLIDQHRDGHSPMHRACWGREDKHTDTVAAFIAAGVPHDLKTDTGKTCYDITPNKKTKSLLKKEKAKKVKSEI
jgi:ankyrin repeat protein